MDERPERTLRLPKGTSVRIAKVHPAWTSVLFATNENLEVRELRRHDHDTPQLASSPPDDARNDAPLGLKWRRQNMQVTAAAFISHGNMLVVSDRGDRLLLLNYHGLQAAKRVSLVWVDHGLAHPSHVVPGAPLAELYRGSRASGQGELGLGLDEAVNVNGSSSIGGGSAMAGMSADGGIGAADIGGGIGGGSVPSLAGVASGGRGVRTVTAIVECPDVAKPDEWRSGTSLLAVSSSRGDVMLLKI